MAIKVPNPERVAGPEDVEVYLAEAQVLAQLDHPNIVPVYDVGRTDDGLCYVVSKYIEGSDLAERLGQGRMSFGESAELVATVAEALHHAHTRGLVHRDIKPANILLDSAGKPCRRRLRAGAEGGGLRQGSPAGRDAGLHEPRAGPGRGPPGRWPLGHLQPGRRLLRAAHRPPALPGRLAHRGPESDRHRRTPSAPADRRHDPPGAGTDLSEGAGEAGVGAVQHGAGPGRGPAPLPSTSHRGGSRPIRLHPGPGQPSVWLRPEIRSSGEPVKIIPKGLRSFDQHDADFFLELLPGPRDRDGLPESLRFWKTRIESTDPDATFRVGLIYGPSGCGKSSLVKAGLLPRLGKDVLAVYIEATAGGDRGPAARRACARRAPELSPGLGLVEALAALRRGRTLRPGQKVLLVLDQFEQWLFARQGQENTELVAALRQCDGEHVQAIVLVRDDFWMAASRFMRELEIRLVEGENIAARRPVRPSARPQGPDGLRPGLRELARAAVGT